MRKYYSRLVNNVPDPPWWDDENKFRNKFWEYFWGIIVMALLWFSGFQTRALTEDKYDDIEQYEVQDTIIEMPIEKPPVEWPPKDKPSWKV